MLLLAIMAGKASAQSGSHEYPLKSVFLLNFAQFTDWPTNALPSPATPFVIGVLGDDPFGSALEQTVRGTDWNGHPFLIQRYRKVEEIQNCEILFISQSEAKRVDKIVAAVKDRPILTVSEIENSALCGVGVQFLTEANKIHLRINTNTLELAHLTMSSKLLRVADLVPVQKN